MRRTTSKESLFSIASDAPCSEVYNIGDKCRLSGDERIGTVAFSGRTQFAPGDWIGLVLDAPDGKNNGSVGGVSYFECEDKYGLFCRPSKLVKLSPSPLIPTSPSLSIANSTATNSRVPKSIYAMEYGYDIGERVTIPGGKMGVVKFLNRIDNDVYVGVLLDRPLGTCDGTLNGKRYFKCNPLYGTFITADKAKKVANAQPSKIGVRHNKASALRQIGGAGTSSVGWRGSQESLNSVGNSSTFSSNYRASPKTSTMQRMPTTPTGIPHTIREGTGDEAMIASLKTCLQEKEAHLERLSKELNDQQRLEMERIAQMEKVNTKLLQQIQRLEGQLEESEKAKLSLQSEVDQRRLRIEELSFLFEEAEVLRADAENTVKRMQDQQQNEFSLSSEREVVLQSEASCQTDAPEPESKSTVAIYTQTDSQQAEKKSAVAICTQTEGGMRCEMAEIACQTTQRELIDQSSQSEEPVKAITQMAESQTAAIDRAEVCIQAELSRDSAEISTQTIDKQFNEYSQQTDQHPTTSSEAQTDVEPVAEKPKSADSSCQTSGVEQVHCSVQASSASGNDAAVETEKPTSQESECQTEVMKELEIRPTSHTAAQTDSPSRKNFEAQVDIRREAQDGIAQTEKPEPLVHRSVQAIPDSIPQADAASGTETVSEERDSQTDVLRELEAKTISHSACQTDKQARRDVEAQVEIRAATAEGTTQTTSKALLLVDKEAQVAVEIKRAEVCNSETQTPARPLHADAEIQAMIEAVRIIGNDSSTQTALPPTFVSNIAQTLPPPTLVSKVVQTLKNGEGFTQTESRKTSEKEVQCAESSDRSNTNAASTQTSPDSSPNKEPQAPVNTKEPVVELDVSKLDLGALPTTIAWEEKYRTQNERVEKLDSTVSFLNSIISEQTSTINKLRTELNESQALNDADGGGAVAAKRGVEARRLREYCDICEVFDQHDTSSCPKREVDEEERRSHNTSLSPHATGGVDKTRGVGRGVSRPFCDICEAFLHDTKLCPNYVHAPNSRH